jgi:hypothetical protein
MQVTTAARTRSACALAFLGFLLGSPSPARAADECITAYEATQVARKAGRFVDARRAAATCSTSSCPRKMTVECEAWGAELDRLTPTVILSFQRPDGSDAASAQVTIDGRATALDGRVLSLDPGPHTVRVELDGFEPLDVQALLQEGEQRRHVGGTLVARAARLAAPAPTPSRAPFIAMVSVGALATGLGIGFGTAALVEYKQLESSCSPRCSPAQASVVRTRAIVTDVSLAIGVASFATAIGLYLRPPGGALVAFLPSTHGGSMAVTGAF